MEENTRDHEIYTASTTHLDETEPESEPAGSGCAFMFCDARGKVHRFIVLFFMCFLSFGSYFCYDNPSSLETTIEKTFDITTDEYALLYSLYSWPNVIMCFFGGYLIDRFFGIRLGANIYMFITLVGQIVFATGAQFGLYWLMLTGRLIFGIGGESLAVAQNNYAVRWFKGKELNMVFGLQLSLARLGSSVNFWVMGPIYDWVSGSYKGYEALGIALYIAGLTCVFSMICSIVLGIFDKRAERVVQMQDSNSDEVKITDVIHFPVEFWLISAICVLFYITIFPFIAVATKFFVEEFHMGKNEAGQVSGLVYIISGVASPFFGFFIDKSGKNIFWIISAIILTVVAHILLGFTAASPYVGVVLMGVSYSLLASSLWPLVSLVVRQEQLGTAYGMIQSIQNLGLATISLLIGYIVEKIGYTAGAIFYVCSLILAGLATVLMLFFNLKHKGTLNMTPGQRKRHQEQIDRDQETQRLLQETEAQADFGIRNRYLSRLGAPLPECYNPDTRSLYVN